MIKIYLSFSKNTHIFKNVEFQNFKNSKNFSKLLSNFKASRILTAFKCFKMYMMYKKKL